MTCEHDDCRRYGECLNDASPELQLRALGDLFSEVGASGSVCGRPYYNGVDITEACELCTAGEWERAGAFVAAQFGAVMLEPEWYEEDGAVLLCQLPHPRSEEDVLAFRSGVERHCAAN